MKNYNLPSVKKNGFTLVEVMVALLVTAMAISALSFQMAGNIDNIAYLRDKTVWNVATCASR